MYIIVYDADSYSSLIYRRLSSLCKQKRIKGMLKQLDKAKSKWGGSHSLIDRWLDDRQKLLSTYCNLLHTEDVQAHVLPNPKELAEFCGQLLDYVSLGHFEVYESLIEKNAKQDPDSLLLASNVYPKINKTTDLALAFNDKYASNDEDEEFTSLAKDLSAIGQAIADRFELEDQLIDALFVNLKNS
jgi:regulator of sigma D